MKYLIVLAIVIFGGIQTWDTLGSKHQPVFDESYVAIYGRKSCGFTQALVTKLKSSGANYHYFSVDEKDTSDNLHVRMQSAGISTKRYNLPVVDTNGFIQVRPEFHDVLAKYEAGL